MNVNRLEDRWNDHGNDTERMVFFSDAIFAVALTLLVIDLRVPELENVTQLPQALSALLPNLRSLLISFVVISFYWLAHHRIFHSITGYDQRLLRLNLVFLLGIVLQPFTTDLISRYGDVPIAVALYAGLLGVTGLVLTAIRIYALANHLMVDNSLDRQSARFNLLRTLVPSLIILLSIPLAFVIEPSWVPWTWLLIIPVQRILRWWPKPVTTPSPPAQRSAPGQSKASQQSPASPSKRRKQQ